MTGRRLSPPKTQPRLSAGSGDSCIYTPLPSPQVRAVDFSILHLGPWRISISCLWCPLRRTMTRFMGIYAVIISVYTLADRLPRSCHLVGSSTHHHRLRTGDFLFDHTAPAAPQSVCSGHLEIGTHQTYADIFGYTPRTHLHRASWEISIYQCTKWPPGQKRWRPILWKCQPSILSHSFAGTIELLGGLFQVYHFHTKPHLGWRRSVGKMDVELNSIL